MIWDEIEDVVIKIFIELKWTQNELRNSTLQVFIGSYKLNIWKALFNLSRVRQLAILGSFITPFMCR